MTPRKRNTRINEKEGPIRIRAVSYVRMSTEGQDDLLSPEAQRRRIDSFADREGSIDMVGEYEDIGISGSTMSKRPGVQRMIRDATSPEHPFDMVIVYDISRLSRNTREFLNLVHMLSQYGVSVQSVAEPHHGDAASDEHWTHVSAGNQTMLTGTAMKTRDSQFEAVRRGYHPGGVPSFGFMTKQIVVKTERQTPGGTTRVRERIHSILVQDPETAPYVKKMYEMNEEGHSTTDIAEYLIEQGVKTKEGNDFTPGAVLNVLHNRRNYGYQERGRESNSQYLPHDEMAINEQAHEGIVSPDVWKRGQEILAARKPESRSPNSQSSPNRFTDVVECGECGSSMVIAKQGDKRSLVCSRKKIRAAYCPNSHREPLDDVQEPAIRVLTGNLMAEEFLNEHVDRVVELNKVLVKEQKKRQTTIDRKKKDLQQRIKSLLDTAEEAERKNRRADEIFDRLDERRTELKQLEAEERELVSESEGLMSYVNDREHIIENALDARTIIEADEPQVANLFIRLFVEKLVIKDHIGTIHFTVPPLSEGPYRPPESFVIGKHLFAHPMGVCIGFLCGGMAGDLQVELGFWPGFGQQPDPVPEPAPEQQPPQPVDAVADYADGPARPAPTAVVSGRQVFRRRSQAAGGDPPVIGVFHPGPIGQGQQRRHRQHQPVPRDARRAGSPGLVPFPSQALDRFEPQLDPEAQRVPTHPDFLRRKVGQDDPGLLLFHVPDRQQGATAFGVGPAESGSPANPGGVGTRNEGAGRQSAAFPGAEGDVFRIPHVGMPALSAYLLPQFGTGQAPVAQHHHGPFPGDRRGQVPQQFHYRVHPGPSLGGAADAPGHGNGATPADHADDDGGGFIPFQWGVNRQGQPAGTPPGQDPSEQRREAEIHVQFGLAGTGPVAAVVQPLPEILAQVVPGAPGREGRGHGVLAGAASQNSPADPQDQPGQLSLSEVGQMRFNHLLHLIAFPGKAHGTPPASGFVIAAKMPDSRALSKFSDQFHSIHTPVSPPPA